ncbi:hypothetical protein GCM10023231_41390 [Olivibacter ginsenosidimutans]|uniref:DUF4198 domain-containing protein n=1 Tax=Olivibacter ginsenosidimutans TaxID=1176537 RepID=A0ABP9CEF4_9SPHI
MKTLKALLLLALITLNIYQLSAHALWIETAQTGKTGQLQTVKLFFGEYAEGERDEIAKWNSDLASLELWLIKPDGQKEKLSTEARTSFLQASFTPGERWCLCVIRCPQN